MQRVAKIQRNTKETQIYMELNLDGTKKIDISTGIGFFDHMLTLFAFQANIDLIVKAKGDLAVCDHHLIEDTGIVLGKLIAEALQEKKGIARYGSARVPMDETLCYVDLDLSGRNYMVYNCDFKRDCINTYSNEMGKEFFYALASNAKMTLHINVLYGENDHHKNEAIFKAFGRALKQAVQVDGDMVLSTKGMLE